MYMFYVHYVCMCICSSGDNCFLITEKKTLKKNRVPLVLTRPVIFCLKHGSEWSRCFMPLITVQSQNGPSLKLADTEPTDFYVNCFFLQQFTLRGECCHRVRYPFPHLTLPLDSSVIPPSVTLCSALAVASANHSILDSFDSFDCYSVVTVHSLYIIISIKVRTLITTNNVSGRHARPCYMYMYPVLIKTTL